MLYTLIQYQQAIMSALGYYKGRCDGFWGPDSVAAKRDWEQRDSFEPGVLSNGAPFMPGCRLPKGLTWSAGKIVSTAHTTNQLNEIINKSGGFLTNAEVAKHVMPSEAKAASAEVPAPSAPVVDDFVETAQKPAVADVKKK